MKKWMIGAFSVVLCLSFLSGTAMLAFALQDGGAAVPSTAAEESMIDAQEKAGAAPAAESQLESGGSEPTDTSVIGGEASSVPVPEEEAAPALNAPDPAENEADPAPETQEAPAEEPAEAVSSVPAETGKEDEAEAAPEPEAGEERTGNPSVTAAMHFLTNQLGSGIEEVAGILGMNGDYELSRGEDNAFEALVTYAVLHGQTENFPYQLDIRAEDYKELASIHWSMNAMNAAKTADKSVIRISARAGVAGRLTDEQRSLYDSLCTDEYRAIVRALSD